MAVKRLFYSEFDFFKGCIYYCGAILLFIFAVSGTLSGSCSSRVFVAEHLRKRLCLRNLIDTSFHFKVRIDET